MLIAHPQSPFKGQHYSPPVESVDVYATLNELLRLPQKRESICGTPPNHWVCQPLDGKSLASVVLGVPKEDLGAATKTTRQLLGNKSLRRRSGDTSATAVPASASIATAITTLPEGPVTMPRFTHDFAISQVIRCAPLARIPNRETAPHRVHSPENKGEAHAQRNALWNDCETRKHNDAEMSLLGYAMRTAEYRYVAYYPYDRKKQRPEVSATVAPYEEELFDHKNETLADFTHREVANLAYRPGYGVVIAHFRTKLAEFVAKAFSNVSPHRNQ